MERKVENLLKFVSNSDCQKFKKLLDEFNLEPKFFNEVLYTTLLKDSHECLYFFLEKYYTKINIKILYNAIEKLIISDNTKINCLKVLLECKILDVNYKNELGETFLIIAIKETNNVFVMNILLGFSDIDLNATDNKGKTALYYACERGAKKFVEFLLKSKQIEVNDSDDSVLSNNNLNNEVFIIDYYF